MFENLLHAVEPLTASINPCQQRIKLIGNPFLFVEGGNGYLGISSSFSTDSRHIQAVTNVRNVFYKPWTFKRIEQVSFVNANSTDFLHFLIIFQNF